MRGATHTQHTAPQKTWVLFFLLTPTHLTSSSLHSYPQIPHLTPTENPSSPSSSLLQKNQTPFLLHLHYN